MVRDIAGGDEGGTMLKAALLESELLCGGLAESVAVAFTKQFIDGVFGTAQE
jgi:hypothetical protein